MRVCKVFLPGFERSLKFRQEFEVGRFTVFFGKNNSGKTNLLEDIYLMLATQDRGGGEARIRRSGKAWWLPRDPGTGQQVGHPTGAVYVELDPDFDFDHSVLEAFPHWVPVEEGVLRFPLLPPRQVCYASTDSGQPELWFTDVSDFYDQAAEGFHVVRFGEEEGDDDFIYEIDEQQRSVIGPFPQPLFLGWDFAEIDTWVTSAIADLTTTSGHHVDDPPQIGYPAQSGWLEAIDEDLEPVDALDAPQKWRIRPEVDYRLEQLALLATDLLPDFLDGSIQATFHMPTNWQDLPAIRLTYHERRNRQGYSLEQFGRGAARWTGIAVQIALRQMESDTETTTLEAARGIVSGHILFIDEPEAHLHYSAVASIVRWCHRMVGAGFNVLTASHHEEFLRASGDMVTFVKVSQEFVEDPRLPGWATTARTIPTATTSTLQELAAEVGMHPAAAFSLHRAILFVEGTLDQAVLDQYAGHELDAAGITILPIHGTKNLEGLIDGEFTTQLGIKAGVLTDNTITETIWDRSNKKRSSEEVKLVRLVRRFKDQGLPAPELFGVAEDDLLFALPENAIREYLKGPFPGWHELREECRAAEGRGPSDSVDWKSYAYSHYGLPITTPDGVRRVVQSIDLAGVPLPSIRAAVDDIIAWAKEDPHSLRPD